jgi:oxygen-independent coproporphyrinogen III oxidase
VQNAAAVPVYRKLLADGKLPVARGIELSRNDRLHRDAIQSLMCDLKVDLDAVAHSHGTDRREFRVALGNLEPLAQRGIVLIRDGLVALAPGWHAAVRLAAAAFDQYLPAGNTRHSSSV